MKELVTIQVKLETVKSGNTELLMCEAKDYLEEETILLIDEYNNVIGEANYDRWNELPWYKRLFGYFFYCYKRKFIDLEGFAVRNIDTSMFKNGDELYLDKGYHGGLTNKKQ